MQSIISNELNFFPQSLVCICFKLDLSFMLTGFVLFLNSFGLFFCRCWMIQVKTICTWVSLARYSSSWQMLHTCTCTIYSTFRCLMYVKPENVMLNTLTLLPLCFHSIRACQTRVSKHVISDCSAGPCCASVTLLEKLCLVPHVFAEQ